MEARNMERLSLWNHLDHKPKRRLRAGLLHKRRRWICLKLDKVSRRITGAACYDCQLNSATSRRHFIGHNSQPGY